MIVLLDYDAGNICSVQNALKKLNTDYMLSDNPDVIRKADKVIFPGVGHAQAAMDNLSSKGLINVIRGLTQPLLGICVGMQLMCESSEEGDVTGLGIIPERVKKFDTSLGVKVPHMGWNLINVNNANSILFSGISPKDHVYFVHSYYVPSSDYTIANCHYGLTYSAAVQKDNFYGIQFHAEKSGQVGTMILDNFLNKI